VRPANQVEGPLCAKNNQIASLCLYRWTAHVVRLLDVEPVINDKLIEFAVVLHILTFTMSKDTPPLTRLVNCRTPP
jgi:hypothetical protein